MDAVPPAAALALLFGAISAVSTGARVAEVCEGWLMPRNRIIGIAVTWTVLSQVLALKWDKATELAPERRLHGIAVALPQQLLLWVAIVLRGDYQQGVRGLLLLLCSGGVVATLSVPGAAPVMATVLLEAATLLLVKFKLEGSSKPAESDV
eukprot:TRINITY_DN34740_c0_g1_i3.p3 TRINITY_DN34740_c0_g1~~TRINITY_DN34740_c0_g1_i3.p3  ORF type:complete len:175 (+),score=66.22 TRINITY_DN34740_c0_g1_i3:75-527(+)